MKRYNLKMRKILVELKSILNVCNDKIRNRTCRDYLGTLRDLKVVMNELSNLMVETENVRDRACIQKLLTYYENDTPVSGSSDFAWVVFMQTTSRTCCSVLQSIYNDYEVVEEIS